MCGGGGGVAFYEGGFIRTYSVVNQPLPNTLNKQYLDR